MHSALTRFQAASHPIIKNHELRTTLAQCAAPFHQPCPTAQLPPLTSTSLGTLNGVSVASQSKSLSGLVWHGHVPHQVQKARLRPKHSRVNHLQNCNMREVLLLVHDTPRCTVQRHCSCGQHGPTIPVKTITCEIR